MLPWSKAPPLSSSFLRRGSRCNGKYRYQVEIPHFPQIEDLQTTQDEVWWSYGSQVPGKESKESTANVVGSFLLEYFTLPSVRKRTINHITVGSKILVYRMSNQTCPMSQKKLMPRYEPGAQINNPQNPHQSFSTTVSKQALSWNSSFSVRSLPSP